MKPKEIKPTNNTNKDDSLELLGIRIEDGKIEIDTNKTKEFFKTLENTIEQKIQNIDEGIKSGKIDLKDSVGLKIEDKKIEIDLNKTKNFFEGLTKQIQNIVSSIDKKLNNLK